MRLRSKQIKHSSLFCGGRLQTKRRSVKLGRCIEQVMVNIVELEGRPWLLIILGGVIVYGGLFACLMYVSI